MRTRTEIQRQYGGTGRNAVNRAIRAECIGGADLLDAMKSLDDLITMTSQGATRCERTRCQAGLLLSLLNLCRSAMEREVLGGD